MAGEWIPLRTDIFDCPQVVRILSELCPDSVRNPSERVRKTSEIVGALVRMWALFDRYTEDGILHNYTSNILDQVVGIDGFSDSVQSVGWLQIHDDCLEMPEFSRYLSKSAKGRMKDSQRKQAERSESEKRPRSVQENSDKKRTTIQYNTKEKNTENTPPNPQGGKTWRADDEELPDSIRTPEMQEAWRAWCSHRREIKKPIKPTQCRAMIQDLVKFGTERSLAAIQYTIRNGWQGLREPDSEFGRNYASQKPAPTDYQQIFLDKLEQARPSRNQ